MTSSIDLQKLRFPIGEYKKVWNVKPEQVNQWISNIEAFPIRLAEMTATMEEQQLNWRYRPDGWTIKQVIHHCADSHMNSFIRFKLALTEDTPTIRPYFEDCWAELSDTTDSPYQASLSLLVGLHSRWVTLLRSLTKEDLQREFIHPENGRQFTVQENIGIYAWHCNHHLAHIKQALESEGSYNQ